MGNRTAKFISAIVGSIIAGTPLAAVSQTTPPTTTAANAGDDCAASPKGAAPQGQHWYYRLERGTKRQCWYLRAEGGKDSIKDSVKDAVRENSKETAKPAQTAQAGGDMPVPATAPPRSVQNARAEYVAPQPPPAASAPPSSAAAGDTTAPSPAVTTRWPDVTAAPAPEPDAAAPAPQAPPPPVAKPARSTSAVTLAAADSATDKPTGSLPTLILVIVGALALAGLIASLIYRFAGSRVRVQASDPRRVNWDHREPSSADDDRAPWLAVAAAAPRAQPPRPIDFDAMRPQAARLAAFDAEFDDEIKSTDTRSHAVPVAHATRDEIEFDRFVDEFEIEAAAPQLAADDALAETPTDREEAVRDEKAADTEESVDIDVITAMLERLAQDGPRLTPPSPEADLAGFARSPRGQSAARA